VWSDVACICSSECDCERRHKDQVAERFVPRMSSTPSRPSTPIVEISRKNPSSDRKRLVKCLGLHPGQGCRIGFHHVSPLPPAMPSRHAAKFFDIQGSETQIYVRVLSKLGT